jgi:hypothetical protein
MVKTEASEFAFVEDLPKREKSRWQKLWEHFEEIKRITAERGILLPLGLAAQIAGVSRQRIGELCDKGTLDRVIMDGHPFVTEDKFVAWAKSDRKGGRPEGKLPGSKVEAFRVAMGYAVAETKARRKRSG